jgi:hypothetical protein
VADQLLLDEPSAPSASADTSPLMWQCLADNAAMPGRQCGNAWLVKGRCLAGHRAMPGRS